MSIVIHRYCMVVLATLLPVTSRASEANTGRMPRVTTIIGWLQVAGEGRVYKHRGQMGRLYDGTCISGVMRNGKTIEKGANNRKVRATGILYHWPLGPSDGLTHIMGMENYCGNVKVMLIDKVVVYGNRLVRP